MLGQHGAIHLVIGPMEQLVICTGLHMAHLYDTEIRTASMLATRQRSRSLLLEEMLSIEEFLYCIMISFVQRKIALEMAHCQQDSDVEPSQWQVKLFYLYNLLTDNRLFFFLDN